MFILIIYALILGFSSSTEVQKPENNLKILKFRNAAYIIEEGKSEGVFIQYEDGAKVNLESISRIHYEKKRGIVVNYLDGKHNLLNLNGNIYGYGKFKGFNKLNEYFVNREKVRNEFPVYNDFTFSDEDDISAIKCGCIKKTDALPNNCAQGGEGSIQCGMSESTLINVIQCETRCDVAYQSCCATDANFQY